MAEPDVLIVGAGLAGLTAARSLIARGLRCVVLDKGRAVGGRMATRTIGEARFDHGAQHFSARSAAFIAEVEAWKASGAVKVWIRSPSRTVPERGAEPRHVGVGGMRRIPERLAAGIDVRTATEVTALDFATGRASARTATGAAGSGTAVILTPPLPQARALLAASGIALEASAARALAAVDYDGCLAVMATIDGPSGLAQGYVAIDAGPAAWVADNQHKGASPVPAITIHSSPSFAADHCDEPPETWVPLLSEAAQPQVRSAIIGAVGHRWRYSMPRSTLHGGCLAVRHAAVPVVVAGEAFAGARVEGAFTSGAAAAEMVVSMLGGR